MTTGVAGPDLTPAAGEEGAPPAEPGRPQPDQVASPLRSALGLVAVVAALLTLAVVAGYGDLALIIVCIVAIVMVHEFGHLLAAKHGHMKVTEYFLGFGPRLWSFRRGETEYGVKAFPLGGYVKIPGMTNLEEVDPADEPRTYRRQPFRARLLVAVAGSAMHFLMAFVLLWVLLAYVGMPDGNHTAVQGTFAIAGHPSPAAVGGLRAGDVLVSVDGTPVGGDTTAMTRTIQSHPGTPLTVVVERGGHRVTLHVTPLNGRRVHEQGVVPPAGTAPYGVIGVDLGPASYTTNPFHALGSAVDQLGVYTGRTVTGVGHLFSPSAVASRFQQVGSAKAAAQATANGTRVESIAGAVNTGAQAVNAGVMWTLLFLVSINLFLGVFNMFPMLPLDGGHVAIAVYERIRTRPRGARYQADVTKLLPFTWLMLGFLGLLFTTSLLNDVLHPMSNPFH